MSYRPLLHSRCVAVLTDMAVFAVAALCFWLLRGNSVQGGDTAMYVSSQYGNLFLASKVLYHVREPGSVWLLQVCCRLFGQGETPTVPGMLVPGFVWMSILSGALFAVFARRFAWIVGRTLCERLMALLLAFSGSVLVLFFGHKEMYAPFMCSLMAMFFAAAACFGRRASFGWLLLAWAIAVTMHRVSLFYLPAFYFVLTPVPGKRIRQVGRKALRAPLVAVIVLCTMHVWMELSYMYASRAPDVLVMEVYNWLPELLTPFTAAQADYVRQHSQIGSFHWFTFGSGAHLRHFVFFVLCGAPLGAPLLLWLGRRVRSDLERFLVTASVCGWIWALLWHPHGSYLDWDLFCHPGLTTNLAAAVLLIARHRRSASEVAC